MQINSHANYSVYIVQMCLAATLTDDADVDDVAQHRFRGYLALVLARIHLIRSTYPQHPLLARLIVHH